MVVRFLGTSAGELYPGMWCQCHNCEAARKGGPKDRRQSAAAYVESTAGEGVLIDFPPEISDQALRHAVALPELRHLLVTHSHGDHWFPYLLRWRSGPSGAGGARLTPLPILHVWGNQAVEAVLRREQGDNLEPFCIQSNRVSVGETFEAGPFRVSALAANHDVGREDALHYFFEEGSRTLLYGLDGDTFLPETRRALTALQPDLVVLEATYGFGGGGNHRNFQRVLDKAVELRKVGTTKIVATHFSPHHCPPHEETERWLAEHDIIAAFDGMRIEA